MADTTSNRSYPFPQASDDYVPHTDIENLAEAVDTDMEAVDTFHTPLVDQRTSDASAVTSTTLATMLTVTLPAAGTYAYDSLIIFTNTGAVGRPGFALGGTSTPTAWRWGSQLNPFNTGSGARGFNLSGTSYPGSTSGQELPNGDLADTTGFCTVRIVGTVTVSAGGTLLFRVSRTSGSSSINVKASSMVTVHRTA